MIISLDKKISEKNDVEKAKKALERFNKLKDSLNQISIHNDDIIDFYKDTISNKCNINDMDLFLLIECQNRFANEAKQIISIFSELGIVELK